MSGQFYVDDETGKGHITESWDEESASDPMKIAKQNLPKYYKTAKARNKHIKRLQERNRELAEALAEERILRKQAYEHYQKRLSSKLWAIFAVTDLLYSSSNDR